MAEQEWSLKACVALYVGALFTAAVLLPWPWVLLLFCLSLSLQADRALALLASWAISKTPKAFHWSIELIRVRPSWSWRPSCWSEITVINWTWHNPPGFEDDARSYILEIDRLCIRVQLLSILGALRNRRAINVKLVCIEGVRFNTQRNEEARLNLWEALHLDDGTNEATIVHGAHHVGGLDHPNMLQHLNEASEQAAPRSGSSHGLRRQDTLLGDPLRRPRWGVPVRFHIQQVCVIGAQLWLFDLLTTDRRWRLVEPKDIRMEVASLAFSWETLAKRDLRRDGHGDGVKGVYLGELVWVLIAQLLPKVLESSKRNLMKTALFAVGFGAWDASVIMSAKALEVALDTKYCLANVMPCLPSSLPRQPSLNQCFVHIHLICGRGLVRQHDQYCNVLVRLELKNPETPQGQVTDLALAPLRMWTKSPWWDQKFCLGPAKCTSSLIRIRCFHCKARHVMSTKCDGLLGQVMVPLSEILAERSRTKDGSIVRWFPLDAASMMIPRHGHLKLGFQLSGQAHLSKRGRAMNVRTNSCVNPSVQIPDLSS